VTFFCSAGNALIMNNFSLEDLCLVAAWSGVSERWTGVTNKLA